ncbi:acyltransferase family protein [Neotabrizicola shimadae]|uniref:Acyltransferase n=1 Tax=Neotabrizicola shimadae TaxID=2807096 RepID=A0A8G0ZRM8_9RHOB|nr:acyltransferase [Neotabrizicola shimadae]QYZ68747.1 acyltransferase [Neotabrizicola shimadae]
MLDWLRFLLASIVVLVHLGFVFPGPIDGQLAVWVFLALSGWLIGGILLRTPQQELPRFYFNRAVRIWIPYGFAVAMLYGVAAFKEGVDEYWWKYLFYDVTFTHYNFTVFPQAMTEMPMEGTGNNYWSISVEEQFYLIAPFMLSFSSRLSRVAAAAFFALAVFFVGVAFLPIAGGVVAASVQKRFGDWHLRKSGRLAVAAALISSFVLLWFVRDFIVMTFFSVMLVLALSVPGNRSRTALFFGAISFPLYLNAWIGIFAANLLARPFQLPAIATGLFQFSLAVLAAVACWYCIDRPVRARRDLWYTRRLGKTAAIAAYLSVMIGWVGEYVLRWYGIVD